MAFMHVSLVELLHHVLMGWVAALEYMLSDACGLLGPRPVVPDA
jgi:hypothetical protein